MYGHDCGALPVKLHEVTTHSVIRHVFKYLVDYFLVVHRLSRVRLLSVAHLVHHISDTPTVMVLGASVVS